MYRDVVWTPCSRKSVSVENLESFKVFTLPNPKPQALLKPPSPEAPETPNQECAICERSGTTREPLRIPKIQGRRFRVRIEGFGFGVQG